MQKSGHALTPEFVLSRSSGTAVKPKDFDWLEKNIPCQAACPAQTDIPGYLEAIAKGNFREAYLINLRDNVFPAVLGRVCTRPCEPVCRHGWEGLGAPVAICFSKRSAADFLQDKEPVILDPIYTSTGKRVGIIGAGSAGLTVARECALWGHEVTVYEKYASPGGLMIQGIPAFRLPRKIVEKEIEQIKRLGVDIRCNTEVGPELSMGKLQTQYDAMVIATGALTPYMPSLPGDNLLGIEHGLTFLKEANKNFQTRVGDHVVVIGGGFTAVDCARMAKRLGAKTVTMCYRRSQKEMYIAAHEIDKMQREEISFRTHIVPVEYRGSEHVQSVRFQKVALGELEESGRCCPKPVSGTEFEIPADTVLLGTGQTQDFSWLDQRLSETLLNDEGQFKAGAATITAIDNVFVAGDVATGPGSLIDAIGHGKQCAREVDRYLMEKQRHIDIVYIEDAKETGRTRAMDEIPRQTMPVVPLENRTVSAEVELGFNDEVATCEASRCYLCHYKFEIDNDLCIYCDRCLKVKPVEKCIVKVSSLSHDEKGRISGYKVSTSSRDYNMLYIDQNECIRCGACVDICPVECISLQKVSKQTLLVEEGSITDSKLS